MPGLPTELIQYAVDTARERGFRQVKIKLGDDSFSATLTQAPEADQEFTSEELAEESAMVEQLAAEPKETMIEAPAVGYFRAADPALAQGEVISAGDKIGEVVALGLANDINSKIDGEIIEVCVTDGDAVEFGQSILLVRQKV